MFLNDQARQRTVAAARNNALWCDAVCRAHGRPGELLDTIWVCRHPTPPFYPNAVTLTPERGVAQLAVLRELRADLAPAWAVKDSFAGLDLTPLGFRCLFDARWIWRPVSISSPALTSDAVWRTVATAAALDAWEQAWNGSSAGESPVRIFVPDLLADPDITIIGAYQDTRIVAGVIANRSGDVVGMSNVFVRAAAAEEMWAGCIAAVMAAFPQLPVVGYEGGEELILAQRHGFEVAGPLRVWSYEGEDKQRETAER